MKNRTKSIIWLLVDGGVEGWTSDELNRYIDHWNIPEMKLIRELGHFFQWLSHEVGYNIYGISYSSTRTVSGIHYIK